MYGGLVLFESEFVHVVAISFTALIVTELLMVALTIRTWHYLMVVAEFFSLGCYLASLAFLNEYFGRYPLCQRLCRSFIQYNLVSLKKLKEIERYALKLKGDSCIQA